jgi:hypothetical protein
MEELKVLVGMVAELPAMAIWVLLGYLTYKLAILGSIYGLIRFVVTKLHDYLIKRGAGELDLRMRLDGEIISGSLDIFLAQVRRCKRATGSYIHGTDVDWLRSAIDDKIEKDANDKLAKEKGR